MDSLMHKLTLIFLALSVSVMPLHGLANAISDNGCCDHSDSTPAHHCDTQAGTDQQHESPCQQHDDCTAGNCLTSASCSTSGPGLTATSYFSYKPVIQSPFELTRHLFSSQTSPPLLQPPCILTV